MASITPYQSHIHSYCCHNVKLKLLIMQPPYKIHICVCCTLAWLYKLSSTLNICFLIFMHVSVYLFTSGANFLCDASPLCLSLWPSCFPWTPPHLLLLTCLCAGLLLSPHQRLCYSVYVCVCVTASGGGGSRLNPSSLLATERFGAGQGEHAEGWGLVVQWQGRAKSLRD